MDNNAEKIGVERKHEDDNGTSSTTKEGLAQVVATHYNKLEEVGLDRRKESRIFFMRNLNNWIKSCFIGANLTTLKDNLRHQSEFRKLKVLDLCCGKGGDLKKWLYGPVGHVAFIDIAETSVTQCEERYKVLPNRRNQLFTAEFMTADCTRDSVKDKLKDKDILFDLVSCQFAFHYCFESLPQANVMLKNASECLRPGGRFIGTIPNAVEILHRLKNAEDGKIGNDVYSITREWDEPHPLFGARYNFQLKDVVDCPEFLVHFPTLVRLAETYGLKLIEVKHFPQFIKDSMKNELGLLRRMKGLETYPARDGQELVGEASHYQHADKYVADGGRVGTLSQPEWEAVNLYLTFVFEKSDLTS